MPRFVLIKQNGWADNVAEGTDYWGVLTQVNNQGSGIPDALRYKTLLVDGQVVETDITAVAAAYGTELAAKAQATLLDVRSRHKPGWMPE